MQLLLTLLHLPPLGPPPCPPSVYRGQSGYPASSNLAIGPAEAIRQVLINFHSHSCFVNCNSMTLVKLQRHIFLVRT